ncbi:MAG TPA: prepilin peptidase [Phenylobacterium sp.]|nr:prepilin peptidase [Phenylobacterium sp.]
MPPPETLRFGIAGVLCALLLWSAVSDIADRRIPNSAILAIIALFVPWSFASHGENLASGLAAGAIGFGVGYVLYLFKVMGAGDAKLFAAVALFTGLTYLHLFALATVLCGGVVAAVIMVARPRRAAAMLTLRGQGDFGRGIPYGVAIAVGGAVVVWGSLTGLLPADILTSGR